MSDPDPWLALAARARAALPAPPAPSLASLANRDQPSIIEPANSGWWPRAALLAMATLVILACLLVRAQLAPSPFAYEEPEVAWQP